SNADRQADLGAKDARQRIDEHWAKTLLELNTGEFAGNRDYRGAFDKSDRTGLREKRPLLRAQLSGLE
ncbi:MAG TPA: hypothetical protein VK864_04820, partial [Longimicrobiales bacterium]|nr:hypothetical protein [Longimicrobiales bacterium]